MESSDNLLVRLYRLAHRQQENFTTEALAHLLQYLVDSDPDVAVPVLNWLTESSFFSRAVSKGPCRIRTQPRTEVNGIPDIRIEAEDLDVIVEVKLDGGLTFEQADAYARELTVRDRSSRALVALTGSVPTNPLPEGIRVRTWGALGQKLLEEAPGTESATTKHLIGQLVGLLNHLYLMPLRVRSPLSEELKAHREWADANPENTAVTRSRIRGFPRFNKMEHVDALRNLLLQMEKVANGTSGVRSCRLDSGPNMAMPWIGFNINDMGYFFFISLKHPERITLNRYLGGVDPDSFDGSFGELYISTWTRLPCWTVSHDLSEAEPDYFKANSVEQTGILCEFFRQAFTFGQRLQPHPEVK